MKPTLSRVLAAAVLAILIVMVSGASGKEPILQPTKLVIVSTTDVKGKTGPCG
jgi:hypothetical protein